MQEQFDAVIADCAYSYFHNIEDFVFIEMQIQQDLYSMLTCNPSWTLQLAPVVQKQELGPQSLLSLSSMQDESGC